MALSREYLDACLRYVKAQNELLEAQITYLQSILAQTLQVDDYWDLDTLKRKENIPPFKIPAPLQYASLQPEPRIEHFLPEEPTGIKRLRPGVMQDYESAVHRATTRYKAALSEYRRKLQETHALIAQLRREYEQDVQQKRNEIAEFNSAIDQIKRLIEEEDRESVEWYFARVLSFSEYAEKFPRTVKVAYIAESKQMVIEQDLPPFEIVPEIGAYKYVKSRDEFTTTTRPISQRKSIYSSLIAQIALRTIHELFEADRSSAVDTIVFNGHVDTIDKATGKSVRPCLVTVRTTRDVFEQLDLNRVDPQACLKFLNASVSKSPDELTAVRPVIEFDMVDSRFIQEEDVISTLDQRPNLMDLTPSEFEALITNLFEKMGLETRLTQPSRDGGVDCVAYDPRPIFGGKVIIQAKRYKNTVGVSAVRDLFGTLQNEGASKGILVTTSGHGKAAFDFAKGKPIELLSGSNLLYLLAEHAGIEAKIEIPDNWKDPNIDPDY